MRCVEAGLMRDVSLFLLRVVDLVGDKGALLFDTLSLIGDGRSFVGDAEELVRSEINLDDVVGGSEIPLTRLDGTVSAETVFVGEEGLLKELIVLIGRVASSFEPLMFCNGSIDVRIVCGVGNLDDLGTGSPDVFVGLAGLF